MPIEPEDRTEDLVSGHRSQFEAHPDSVENRKQPKSQCRMVVEFFFDFDRAFLNKVGKDDGTHYLHPLDYLRVMKGQLDRGEISIQDLQASCIDIRYDAAK